jgi:hypothetical protein
VADSEPKPFLERCEEIVAEVLARYPDSLQKPLPVTLKKVDPDPEKVA